MIGDMIKKIRKDKKFTLTELSKKTGLNLGHLSHIERGRRTPSLKSLEIIAKALDVPVYELFNFNHSKNSILNIKEEDNAETYFSTEETVYSIPIFDNINECLSTSNLDADFALEIDDNSLEPFIPKDSRIFIKKCKKLEKEDLGLFWKDGKLLCGKFNHNNIASSIHTNQKKNDLHFLGKIVSIEKIPV